VVVDTGSRVACKVSLSHQMYRVHDNGSLLLARFRATPASSSDPHSSSSSSSSPLADC
jgi:hypothetical protein